MNLEVSDGFNFAMGQWLAEVTRLLIGGAAFLVIAGVVYGGVCLYEWWYERRLRK